MDNRSPMQTKIIGIYKSRSHADETADQLVKRGISRDQIYISHVSPPKKARHAPLVLESVRDQLESFFHSVFDDVDEEKIQEAYADVIKNENLVLSVDTHNEEQEKKIAAFMSDTYGRHKPSSGTSPKNTVASGKTSSHPQATHHQEEKKPDDATLGSSKSLVFTNIFDKTENDSKNR